MCPNQNTCCCEEQGAHVRNRQSCVSHITQSRTSTQCSGQDTCTLLPGGFAVVASGKGGCLAGQQGGMIHSALVKDHPDVSGQLGQAGWFRSVILHMQSKWL